MTSIYNGKLPTLVYDPNSIFTWCPQLNLILVSMNKMSIWCYRINGDRIYSINNKSAIKQITFHDTYFCVSGYDHLIKIYNANDGSLVQIVDYKFDNIRFLNWNRTTFELENDKLSKLPKIYDLENDLNYLVINDNHSIVFCFNMLLSISIESDCKLDQQVNSNLFNQVFLSGELLVSIKFKIQNKQLYIDSIIKVCQLCQLFKSLSDSMRDLECELKDFMVAVDRYLGNLKDEIDGDIIKYLSDLLITNLIPESSKDYWLNQFGERGYKKLHKMSNHLKDYCRNTIFQYMISVMERIIMLINDLRGIFEWDIQLANVDALLSLAKSRLKFYYKLLWDLNAEFDQFDEFFKWIKTIIDTLNQQDCELNYSTSNVLQFITDKLSTPSTLNYFSFDLECMSNTVCTDDNLELEFDKILSIINNNHSSIISVEVLNHLSLPDVYTNLRVLEWNETVVAYLHNSNLIISSLNKQLSSIPNVRLFEISNNEIIALTDKNLIIINSSSMIPVKVKTSFEPKRLCLNNQYGCLVDSKNQNYSIFKYCLSK